MATAKIQQTMMKVSDIMTRDVITIRNFARVSQAVKLMRQHRIHALIVDRTHDQDAYGIVTAVDIVAKATAFGRDPRRIRIHEIMTKPCVVLNPDLGVEYAARLLTATGIHSAPVIQGELLGILSVTDILDQSDFLDNPQEVELAKKIKHLIQTARSICQEQGPGSEECAEAWAIVDALQAEAAHQRTERLEKTAFEAYRDEYPEAFKDRDYENWCSG